MSLTENNLEFADFPHICRFCLFKGDTKPFTQDLQELVLRFLNITIEDELPKNICQNCITKLDDFKNFIDLALISNAYLKDIILKHKHRISSESFNNDCKFEIIYDSGTDDNLDGDFSPTEDSDKEYTGIKLEDNGQTIKNHFHCKICETDFKTMKGLINHRKQNTDCAYKCHICNETFGTNKKLYKHRRESRKCTINGYKCIICCKVFKSNSSLQRHQGAHKAETPYECNLCDKKFKFPQNLKRHDNIVHKGIKAFKCDICGKEFARTERLRRHEKLHITCGYCGNRLRDLIDYREHLGNHNLSNQEIEECIAKKTRKLCCFRCDIQFQSRSQYNSHLLEHKLQNGDINGSDTKCDICEKLFSSKKALQNHVEVHNARKEFLCTVCGKDFLRKYSLELHAKIHTEEKPFECEQCGKRFKQPNTYNTHKLIHTDQKTHKCGICSKTFRQSTHLNRHYLTHTGEKPFQCPYCDKYFAQNCNLKTHLRIHTGENHLSYTVSKINVL